MRVDLREQRDLYNGFGDGLARAFELALTPAVFAVAGFGLDRWLGVVPLFTIVLLVLAMVGTVYMTWFRYEAAMKQHEADRRASRAA